MTVDRLLRQPPVHIDGKGLRAYRSLEKMAAKVSKEPTAEVSNLCCVRSQRELCCVGEDSEAAIQRKNQPFVQPATEAVGPRIE